MADTAHGMRRCGSCGAEKPSADFNRKASRAAAIDFVAAHLLTHPCVDCGTSDIRVLDFDHRPDVEKRDAVMAMVRNGFARATLAAEIAKCEVRCRNCHAIATYERMGANWRSRVMAESGRDQPVGALQESR